MKKPLCSELLEQRHLMVNIGCTAADVPFVGTCTLPEFSIPDSSSVGAPATFFQFSGGSVSLNATNNNYQQTNNPALELYSNGILGFGYQTLAQGFGLTIFSGVSSVLDPSYTALAQCNINANSGYEGGGFGTICKTSPGDKYLANFVIEPIYFPIISRSEPDGTTGIVYSGSGTTITPNAYLTVTGNLQLSTTMDPDNAGCLTTNDIKIIFTGLTVKSSDGNTVLLDSTVSGSGPQAVTVGGYADSGPTTIWNPNIKWSSCSDAVRQKLINAANTQFPRL